MKRIDHILIKVDDLHAGVAEFKRAGFNVYYGKAPEKAYNALIYLQDDSFLELVDTSAIPWYFRLLTRMGIIRLIHTLYNRMGNFAFKAGPLLDYVVYTPDIEATYARVKSKSSAMVHGKREKPNGTVVSWDCFAPKEIDWPFLKSDYDPGQISAEETDEQPNGITGIQSMDVTYAGDPADFRERFMHYYAIDSGRMQTDGKNFCIQTDNAKVNYIWSNQHKITGVTLRPLNRMIDEKLGKYGLSTADEVSLSI
ncbi:MAG: VOC family protein [Chloroflexota bacterium]